ncbi:MAG TPA: DUF1688 family protein [Polyangiales bacterium]|nr:DUF1688 family protein [Polyangiales bacterium]
MTVSGALSELRDPRTIRARCDRILEVGLRGELEHFAIDLAKLKAAAHFTAEVTRERYPSLEVPEHGRMTHFDASGIRRSGQLMAAIAHHPQAEQSRLLIDVVLTSVLLDAGAGTSWHYSEPCANLRLGRSEGLAVASLAWVKSGALSSRGEPYEVDAEGLLRVTEEQLATAFQVGPTNPLVGLPGRLHLLHGLGRALTAHAETFGPQGRPGGLLDYCVKHCTVPSSAALSVSAPFLLGTLLAKLSDIWPGRLTLDGEQLGDVWRHAALGGASGAHGGDLKGEAADLVPFHKLTQWLTYSLIQPLRVAGVSVRALDQLTGLAEYRNGGLFLDSEVLVPKHAGVLKEAHEVGSELVVEWRALTVALLDRLAPLVRSELGVREDRLPLVAVLEGGTWAAGRRLAATKRREAMPPIRVISDGTVF